MRRIVAPVEGTTRADLRSLVRWMRGKRGQLRQEWEAGVIGRADYPGVPSFRWVLQMLDGSEAGVREIEVDEFAAADIRALFSAYRRLRRAERRLSTQQPEPTDSDVVSGSEAGFRAFLLALRKRTGRPLSGLEQTLAHVAYAAGHTDGADWASRDVEANMPDETEDG